MKLAGGGDFTQDQFDAYVDTAQQQMMYPPMPQQYTEVPNEIEEITEIVTDYWFVGVIFLVGAITLGVAAFKVFRKNAWVSELFRMWGIK